MSAATARRCLHTLVDLGYAAKRGKLFLLRPAVVSFASAYLESMNLEQIVRPYLQEVRDKTGDSSSLAVLSETEILYLVHVSTNRMVRVPCTVGTRFPAYPTSLGRVLLAYQSKDVVDDYFRKAKLTALTEKTVTSKSALRTIFTKVREERYASIEDELDYGLVSGCGAHLQCGQPDHRGRELLHVHGACRSQRHDCHESTGPARSGAQHRNRAQEIPNARSLHGVVIRSRKSTTQRL